MNIVKLIKKMKQFIEKFNLINNLTIIDDINNLLKQLICKVGVRAFPPPTPNQINQFIYIGHRKYRNNQNVLFICETFESNHLSIDVFKGVYKTCTNHIYLCYGIKTKMVYFNFSINYELSGTTFNNVHLIEGENPIIYIID